MSLRCLLRVNGAERRLLLVSGPNEPEEHLALKLAAYLLFWAEEPALEASFKNPALAGFDFLPDLLALDADGGIGLWVECGSTTLNKLTKLTRRVPRGRIVVLKESEREARRLREELRAELTREARIEVLAWPGESFREWAGALRESNEVYGESGEAGLNVVVNEHPFAIELKRL